MTRKTKRAAGGLLLTAALLAGMAAPAAPASEAKVKSPKLSTKSMKLTVGKTKTIKIKNSKKKAVWSIKSGKKYVSLIKKKASRVSVKGKRKGKAVILAKVAGKKLTCRVTVKGKSTPGQTAPPSASIKPNVHAHQSPGPSATTEPTSTPEQSPVSSAPTEPTTTPGQSPGPSAPTGENPTNTPQAFSYDGLDTSWIDAEKPMVAFTFDDGPVGNADTDTSMIIQSALKKYNAHATFFYIGGNINTEGKEAEIKQAIANGFEIGNHSWGWGALNKLTAEAVKESVDDTNTKLKELSGFENFLFRAPNLAISDTMKSTIQAPFINCATDSKDWNNATTEQIIENVKKAKDGDIVLMHETQKNTAAAIEELLKYFTDKGWQVVSVSELFAVRQSQLLTGQVYYNCPKQ